MTAPRLTSRLAARQGIRQVEAHTLADRTVATLNRQYAEAWHKVLRLIKTLPAKPGGFLSARDGKRIETAFGDVYISSYTSLRKSLKSIAGWGHRSAVSILRSELPAALGQAAALGRVEDGRLNESSLPRDHRTRRLNGGSEDGNDTRPTHFITEDINSDLAQFIFPAPDESEVNSIIYAGNWQERLAQGTRLGAPEMLAGILSRGLIAGKNHREIARDLLPYVENVRTSATRIARTESLRVAAEMQMRCHDQLGDLVIGYQIHATLDQNTRPEHAARSGTIYYEHPGPGQLGYDARPNPPHESPNQGNKMAWNCRCWLTPVLRPPDKGYGTRGNHVVPAAVPDPLVYSDWFEVASEPIRRVAVGTRRYSLVRDALNRPPEWADFLDPETGSLLTQAELEAETPTQRSERKAKVRSWLAYLRQIAKTISQFGFLSQVYTPPPYT
jgi:SPP1 gp7 family putative phage head morphogenesis protein